MITADELRTLGRDDFASAVRERVGQRPVFLSFDVDFLDPAFAPGTGTPVVGGFSTAEAIAFLRALRGIRLAGADIVESRPSLRRARAGDLHRRSQHRLGATGAQGCGW